MLWWLFCSCRSSTPAASSCKESSGITEFRFKRSKCSRQTGACRRMIFKHFVACNWFCWTMVCAVKKANTVFIAPLAHSGSAFKKLMCSADASSSRVSSIFERIAGDSSSLPSSRRTALSSCLNKRAKHSLHCTCNWSLVWSLAMMLPPRTAWKCFKRLSRKNRRQEVATSAEFSDSKLYLKDTQHDASKPTATGQPSPASREALASARLRTPASHEKVGPSLGSPCDIR